MSNRSFPADEDLVLQARSGSKWAQEALYLKHVDRIVGFSLCLVQNRADAEDAVQETFLQAFRDLKALRNPKAFQPWLMRIAVNRANRCFSRRRIKRLFHLSLPEEDFALESHMTDGAPQEQYSELRLLNVAIRAMVEEERVCWILRYLEGYKIGEIAKLVSMSPATVKRRIGAAELEVEKHFNGGSGT